MSKRKEGFVYFAVRPDGLCKIGASRDPAKRIAELKPAAVLHHVVATNDQFWLESLLQRFFSRYHQGGEWFALSPSVLEEVLSFQRHDRICAEGRYLEEEQTTSELTISARSLGQKGGKAGGKSRALKLSPQKRQEIARRGGLARARRLNQTGDDTTPKA